MSNISSDLVSVIMPSYNTGKYIAASIDSVRQQTYQNWELIIVDDCSTDDTDSIVKAIQDSRIRYLKNNNNLGAAISRNRALREAKGRWIAFLDSDDLWSPDKLKKQIEFMKMNAYSFSYTKYEEIDENGQLTGVKVSGPQRINKTGMYNYCWPGCLTVMYDVSRVGLIQIENIKKNNDYAMWLKICHKVDCYLLDEYLAFYRKGRIGSISTQKALSLIRWHYRLYHDAEHCGLFISAFNTCRNMVFGYYKKKKYVKTYRNEKENP